MTTDDGPVDEEFFSFLHISDLHLSAFANTLNAFTSLGQLKIIDVEAFPQLSFHRPTTFDNGRAAALARYVTALAPHIDALLITGDIATSGLQEDIAEALAFVTLPLRTSLHKGVRYPALGSAKDKLILIPGNHDRYEWERNFPPFYKPGGRLFDAVFKDYWSPSLDRVQSWDIGNRGRIFAVGADLCLVDHNDVGGNKWASLGQGKAHDEVIKEMEGESSRLKAIGGSIFLIWIIHFSPVACSNQWLRLLDAEKLIAAAARCGVHLILCGHLHTREWVSVADNRILFRAGTPTSLDAKMHCFHLVNIGLSSQRAGSLAKVKISDFGWTTSGSFAPQPSSIPDLTFEI